MRKTQNAETTDSEARDAERGRIMDIELIGFPGDADWMNVYRRALVTEGKERLKVPGMAWRLKILKARHSPIRYLVYSFYIKGIPYWVSTHLVRHHEGFQPYVKSQRNDRQTEYDRNSARQDSPVDMIIDINAEALMNLANKRLCAKASAETRDVVRRMCDLAAGATPELESLLVPDCVRHNGVCYEMKPCGRWE